jgi:phosphopentomutase
MALFGTAGIRGDVRERVTPELALSVGRAIGTEAREEHAGKPVNRRATGTRRSGSANHDEPNGTPAVVLGRDGRTTGPALVAALEAGIESAGVGVRRAGQVPTPALAFASEGRWGVMVTASHNPPTDNGIKCFADGQEIDRTIEERIEERIESGTTPAPWNEWAGTEMVEGLSTYRKAVIEYARGHGGALDGLTVAVDCANGVAGLVTPQVLRALGADVLAIHANVDGHFPGRASKPTAETLADLRAFVANRRPDEGTTTADNTDRTIDLAIAHDGDGDRIVVLDGEGAVIHEDTIVAILAERYVRASTAPDPVVVTTPNASSRIDERVEAAGGRIERVRLGALHEGVANARAAGDERTDVVFAAEPWKHMHPAFGPWIDGVVSAAVIARLVADADLALLRGPVSERPYEKTEADCPDGRKEAAMARLETALPAVFPGATVSTEHGIRLDLGDRRGDEASTDAAETADGWVLVRPSGTEPYLRVYVESESVETVRERALDTVTSAIVAVEDE